MASSVVFVDATGELSANRDRIIALIRDGERVVHGRGWRPSLYNEPRRRLRRRTYDERKQRLWRPYRRIR